MQNSKLMTTAYYRCTKMVVTKTVIGDNAMRMKSQPQLATRWLWSFAFPYFESILLSFALNPFESIQLSFVLNAFKSILLSYFQIHYDNFAFICFESIFLSFCFKSIK